jgi:hypothetical protein
VLDVLKVNLPQSTHCLGSLMLIHVDSYPGPLTGLFQGISGHFLIWLEDTRCRRQGHRKERGWAWNVHGGCLGMSWELWKTCFPLSCDVNGNSRILKWRYCSI